MVRMQTDTSRCLAGSGVVVKVGSLWRGVLTASLLAWAPVALAQDDVEDEPPPVIQIEPPSTPKEATPLPPPPPPEDDLPIPTLTIDRVPPNTSFEFAVQVSYGSVAYFQDAVPPWIGFGFRGGWGKNLGVHRLGVGGTFTAEGDFGVHTLLALEPTATWDFVSPGGLLLGAGAGPALMYTNRNATVETVSSFEIAPSVVARIGWSQTWSRVGRRLFIFVEPKLRFTGESYTPLVAVAVGSGAGR